MIYILSFIDSFRHSEVDRGIHRYTAQ
jgi:hypothetical protein